MKKRSISKKAVVIIVILITLLGMPIVNLAHSGRTDSSGGHRDNKNASGLGSYHYHCGGYPAHLHSGGVCPYSSSATTSTTSSSTSSSSTSSKSTTTPKKVTATKIEVNVDELEVGIGEKQKLVATISPSNVDDKSITWKSSNKDVVMIDSEGELVALAEGKTIITARTSNGKEAKVNVTVNAIEVTNIVLNEKYVNLKVDESFNMTAIIFPENATNKTVEWSSENPEVATVENGVIKAISLGTTKVICKSENDIKVEVNVIVKEEHEEITQEENTIEVVATVDNNSSNSSSSDGDAMAGLLAMGVLIGVPVYAYDKIKKEKHGDKK